MRYGGAWQMYNGEGEQAVPCHINWLAANYCPIGPAMPQPLDDIHFGEQNTRAQLWDSGAYQEMGWHWDVCWDQQLWLGLPAPAHSPARSFCFRKPLPTSWSSNRITQD